MRDSGALLGTALDEFTELARDVHKALAGRIFGMFGTAARPARLLHDAIAATAYGGTRARRPHGPGRRRRCRRRDRQGDRRRLRRHAARPLHPQRAERLLGRPPRRTTRRAGAADERAHPRRTAASHARQRRPRHATAPDRPARRVPARPVRDRPLLVVRCRAALGRSQRDLRLAAARRRGVDAAVHALQHRPAHLRERSAARRAISRRWSSAGPCRSPRSRCRALDGRAGRALGRAPWPPTATSPGSSALRHIVGLGAPHLGAPLERFVNAGTHAMARLPETRPIATWLNRRSVGIKDLRHGSVLEDDWHGFDPDDRDRPLTRGNAAARRRVLDGVRDARPTSRRPLRPRPARRTRQRARHRRPNAYAGSTSRSIGCSTSAGARTSTCSTTRRSTNSCASGSTEPTAPPLRPPPSTRTRSRSEVPSGLCRTSTTSTTSSS